MTRYTPVYNWPAPEGSDPPRGWEQIWDLAVAIEATTSEPTWTACTLATNMDGYAYVTRTPGGWHLIGEFVVKGGATVSDAAVLCALPADARPQRYTTLVGTVGNANFAPNTVRVDVLPAGGQVKAVMGGTNKAGSFYLNQTYALPQTVPDANTFNGQGVPADSDPPANQLP